MNTRQMIMLSMASLIGVICAPGAWALVDMRNANYSDTWVDMEVEGAGRPVRLERTYNSRSLFDGWFGFGWCSEFETSVRVFPDGQVVRTECGAGFEEVFVPPDYTTRVDELVRRIVGEQRKVLSWRDDQYFAEQTQLLRGDARLRRRWFLRLNWTGEHREGTRLSAVGGRDASIVFEGGVYSLSRFGSVERFNSRGQMIGRLGRNGIWQTLSYDGTVVRTVSFSTGESFEFTPTKDGRIARVLASNGKSSRYTYSEQGDLIGVSNGWGNAYTFQYDHLHNLIEIAYPDNTYKRLTYNTERDWVIAFKERDGCEETYDYLIADRDTWTSKVVKTCNGKVVNRSSYEFWYKQGAIDRYMSRVRTISNDQVTDVTYHEKLGRPTRIVRDGRVEEYDYGPDGWVVAFRGRGRTVTFNYNSSCKGKVADATELDRQTFYRYDDRCDLVLVRDTQGARISLTHNRATAVVEAIDETGGRTTLFKNADGMLVVAPEKEQTNVGAAKRLAALLSPLSGGSLDGDNSWFRDR